MNDPDFSGDAFTRSYSSAYVLEQLRGMDAIAFLLAAMRFCTFLRISRPVLVVFRVLGAAMKNYCYYGFCIFAPVLFGFVFLGHTIYAGQSENFSTLSEALVTLLVFVRGDIDLIKIGEGARMLTPMFMGTFFFFITIFLINGFVGAMVLAFIQVQIVEGDPWNTFDHRWGTAQWMEWLFSGCPRLPRRKKKRGEDDEDDEDAGEDEDVAD